MQQTIDMIDPQARPDEEFAFDDLNLLAEEFGGLKRNLTREVQIGQVKLGGQNPIVIQSMTNTDTADVAGTTAQIMALADAGSELVRLTVNTEAAAQSVPKIQEQLVRQGYDVPLIGDFHYNGHILLKKYPACAESLAKYRINPGNVGFGQKHDVNFKAIINMALQYDKPVRIGVNWGSLNQQTFARLMDENARMPNPKSARDVTIAAVVKSALQSAKMAEAYGMASNKIVLSTKMSQVQDVTKAYELLAKHSQYALHVGLTEAGLGTKGIVGSTAAVGYLLQQGIGDTIRVSLTPRPGAPRTEEVEVCKLILQTMNLRKFSPSVTSCPGCGRTTSTLFQEMTADMEGYFQERVPEWKKRGLAGFEDLQIAVMGCIVNGPGESKQATIGISLPGTGESPRAPVYVDGERVTILAGPTMMSEFKQIVDNYVEENYAP